MLASTSEVYGHPLVHPQSEEYWGNVNQVGVRGVYDEAKRYAEALKSSESSPVNLGNPVEHTVLEIVETIIEISGSEMVFEPLPEDDPKHRCPQIARARGVLGWEPRIEAREGLQRTLSLLARS